MEASHGDWGLGAPTLWDATGADERVDAAVMPMKLLGGPGEGVTVVAGKASDVLLPLMKQRQGSTLGRSAAAEESRHSGRIAYRMSIIPAPEDCSVRVEVEAR
ncbi:MAG: hypothetical protein ACI9K5_003795 [Gammaproteobacteria bacterium]|jgi:hypothetical protein